MLKPLDIISKTVWQIFVYLFEVLVVSFGITYLTNRLLPILSYMEFLERMLMAYTIYQILVVVILTNLNDIKKDSYLALMSILKVVLLYLDTKDVRIKTNLMKRLELQLDTGTFNSIEIRNIYSEIKNNLDELEKIDVEMQMINAEHAYEAASLNWRFSFFLRLLK